MEIHNLFLHKIIFQCVNKLIVFVMSFFNGLKISMSNNLTILKIIKIKEMKIEILCRIKYQAIL